MSNELKVLSVEYDSESDMFVKRVRSIAVNDENTSDTDNCDDDELFNVWFDGEGLNKTQPIPTFYLDEYQIICGNLVFTKTDDEGNNLGLTEEEMSKVWIFYLRHFILLIKFLYEYHAEDFLLNLAINEHCLPALKGIYESFKEHFTCKPVDEQFKNFVGIS